LFAGLFAGEVSAQAVELMSGQYLQLVWMPVGAAIVLLLLAKMITRMGAADSAAVPAEPAAVVAGPSSAS
jgi:hypothetical protein